MSKPQFTILPFLVPIHSIIHSGTHVSTTEVIRIFPGLRCLAGNVEWWATVAVRVSCLNLLARVDRARTASVVICHQTGGVDRLDRTRPLCCREHVFPHLLRR